MLFRSRQVLSADIQSQDENWCEMPPLPHPAHSLSCLKLTLPPSLPCHPRRGEEGVLSPSLKGPRTFPFAVSWLPLHNKAPSSPLRPPSPFPMFGWGEALSRGEVPESPVCQGGWPSFLIFPNPHSTDQLPAPQMKVPSSPSVLCPRWQ